MKKLAIKRQTNIILSGICLSLFSVMILLSHGTAFNFVCTGICWVFGFIGFWLLIPFLFILGLYIAFRRKLVNLKLGLSLWGVFVIVLSLMVITSNWGDHATLTFSNSVSLFNENKPFDPFTNPSMGGGFFGYVLAGTLNNAISEVGTSILCWILVVVGICLVLNKQVVKLWRYIFNKKKAQKVEHQPLQLEESYAAEEDEPSVTPIAEVPETKNDDDLMMQRRLQMSSFNDNHGLKKPVFSLSGEKSVETPVEQAPIMSESTPEPIFNPTPTQEAPVAIVQEQPVLGFERPSFSNENASQVQPQVQKQVAPVSQPQEEYSGDPLYRPQPKAKIRAPYVYPSADLLTPHESIEDINKNDSSCAARTELINEVFRNLGVGAEVVGHTIGPSVTRFDIQTHSNVSVASINKVVNDLSVRLGGIPARFETIVPGKATSGLEIQNEIRTNVGLFESIKKMDEMHCKPTDIIFGKNISGDLITANLVKFPHLLVAGTTGSGKSIFMHATILTLIMRNSPQNLKLLLIDPKKVEMAYYQNIPHLLCPNISDPRKANNALEKLVDEMERRYNLFEANRVRDIGEFNDFAKKNGLEPLPYIVVFIDEYADLSEACKEIRTPVVRIAQKARSAGVHLVIATQRPSVNVIDGVIKANVPVHVALMTSNYQDSTCIIGEGGAENLLGNGDMLVECSLVSRTTKVRVQGCFVDSPEINRVCDAIRESAPPEFDPEFLDLTSGSRQQAPAPAQNNEEPSVTKVDKNMQEERLYEIIKEDIQSREYCSISFLTRSYGIGFPKAGRLFQKLINDGYVAGGGGDARGSKVLIHTPQQQQVGSIEQSEFIPDNPEQDFNRPEEDEEEVSEEDFDAENE